MVASIHDLGDQRDLRFVTSITGSPVNPTDLTFTMLEPDGTVTEYVKDTDAELEAVVTGTWRVLWTCAQAGMHRFRFAATGNIVQSAEHSFFVRRSKVMEAA